MALSLKKQLAYLQQLIYNFNKGYFMGRKEAAPIGGTGIKIMISGTERRWLLPALIVLGALCLFFIGSKLSSSATAQAELQTGTDSGILVIPVQIERDSYGLAMVDTVGQTLWIYELNSRGPAHSRLKLLAARSWRYDKLLQQYNTAEPKPEQVKMLLENLGQLQKTPKKEKQQNLDMDILEMAEPDSRDFGG